MSPACVTSVCDQQFEQAVLQSEQPVLVDFSTEWCPPCRAAAQVLQQICAEGRLGLKIVTVDPEQCRDVARRHRIGSLPTFVLYRGGKSIAQTTGFGAKKPFVEWLESSLAKA